MKHRTVWALCFTALLAGCSQEGSKPTPATPSTPAAGTTAANLPPLPVQCPFFSEVVDNMDEPDEAMGLDPISTQAILEALKNCTPEYLLEKSEKDITFKKLMTDPNPYRGHAVTVSGVFQYKNELKIPSQIKGAPPVMYQGILATGKKDVYTFLSLQPIPADVKEGTGVRVSGIFLKRFCYVNRMAGEMATWSPLLFVVKAEKYSELEGASK